MLVKVLADIQLLVKFDQILLCHDGLFNFVFLRLLVRKVKIGNYHVPEKRGKHKEFGLVRVGHSRRMI